MRVDLVPLLVRVTVLLSSLVSLRLGLSVAIVEIAPGAGTGVPCASPGLSESERVSALGKQTGTW